MKPSEILAAIVNLDNEVRACEENVKRLKAQIAPNEERIVRIEFAQKDIKYFLDQGEPWSKIEERLSDLACGIIPDDPQDPKPQRKTRSDRGQPRKPQTLELTASTVNDPRPMMIEIIRERLSAHFTESGPMPLALVAERMGTDEAGALHMLTQDTAHFVKWRLLSVGGERGVEVWSTKEQFVKFARDRCPPGAVPSDIMNHMGCSLDAAKILFERAL